MVKMLCEWMDGNLVGHADVIIGHAQSQTYNYSPTTTGLIFHLPLPRWWWCGQRVVPASRSSLWFDNRPIKFVFKYSNNIVRISQSRSRAWLGQLVPFRANTRVHARPNGDPSTSTTFIMATTTAMAIINNIDPIEPDSAHNDPS